RPLVWAAPAGALHALGPGPGKTVVAAFLVGSRGTAWHAVILGLIVTASHTAGVYLLGAATVYASRYIVPERIYPWVALGSGLAIAVLGLSLFLRRYAGREAAHTHAHHHHHDGHHHDGHGDGDMPAHGHGHAHHHHHSHEDTGHHRHAPGRVSLSQLWALGITGGIVPCPAALVVLLSALSLRRVGFGLLLIVAFSFGLAVVLVAIGLLVVYAGRLVARLDERGPLVTRWLPLMSPAVMALLGLSIAIQTLASGGLAWKLTCPHPPGGSNHETRFPEPGHHGPLNPAAHLRQWTRGRREPQRRAPHQAGSAGEPDRRLRVRRNQVQRSPREGAQCGRPRPAVLGAGRRRHLRPVRRRRPLQHPHRRPDQRRRGDALRLQVLERKSDDTARSQEPEHDSVLWSRSRDRANHERRRRATEFRADLLGDARDRIGRWVEQGRRPAADGRAGERPPDATPKRGGSHHRVLQRRHRPGRLGGHVVRHARPLHAPDGVRPALG